MGSIWNGLVGAESDFFTDRLSKFAGIFRFHIYFRQKLVEWILGDSHSKRSWRSGNCANRPACKWKHRQQEFIHNNFDSISLNLAFC